uniref:J domain-containing protein n=1 Tax=Angomonas deanei TaxID=59799 RepID=C6K3M3_9TRYP|nr:conserved hypothetical protein [Angomonas deanei]
MQTLYDVLGVPVSATQDEIHNAYRQLLLRFHPDRHYCDNDSTVFNPLADLDDARLNVLNKAHDILSDPNKRRLYNAYLSHKLQSRAAHFQSEFPQQWYARSSASAEATDDVLRSVAEALTAALHPVASNGQLTLTTNTTTSKFTPAQKQQTQQQQQQQQQQKNEAPMTQVLNAPVPESAEAEPGMPIVYTAAISMQRQPDGTVSVRSFKSGPRTMPSAKAAAPTNTNPSAAAATATEASTTSAASSSSSSAVPAGELPRRVRVIQQQLAGFGGHSDVLTALTNSMLSMVAAASGEA